MTVTLTREEAQQVLDDLEALTAYIQGIDKGIVLKIQSIETLRTRLAQPEREWQGLTDAEAEQIVDDYWHDVDMFIEAIEVKLREKNA
jgi:hypothetical protein